MEKNISTIYKIQNKINQKVYIGFDSKYPKRIQQHYNHSKRGVSGELYEDIRMFGWENFSKEIVYQSNDKNHCLNVMEKHFIDEYQSKQNGYNRTKGGQGTFGSERPKSDEWCKQHSESMKKNNPRTGYIFSEDEKKQHSLKMKDYYKKNPEKKPVGEKNGMYGKTHSEEWRKKHSETMKKNKTSVIAMSKKSTCVYCGFTTTLGNIARYHNEKCKSKK